MFLGHFGLALAAKRVAPQPSLGTTILAAQWADGIWPIFVLLGLEHVEIRPGITAATPLDFVSYPYSHSLVADLLWALLFAGIYVVMRKDRRGAAWLGVLVMSHWVLDVVSHRPDMPTWPGGPKLGAGLWNSIPASIATEVALLAIGLWLYLTSTVAPRQARQRSRMDAGDDAGRALCRGVVRSSATERHCTCRVRASRLALRGVGLLD